MHRRHAPHLVIYSPQDCKRHGSPTHVKSSPYYMLAKRIHLGLLAATRTLTCSAKMASNVAAAGELDERILTTIGNNQEQKVASKEVSLIIKIICCYWLSMLFQTVALKSFWTEQPAVIYFMRRFGWQLCRLGAIKLSLLRPTMDANNVNMVAVGLEQLGAEDFVAGKFFDGGMSLFCVCSLTNRSSCMSISKEMWRWYNTL